MIRARLLPRSSATAGTVAIEYALVLPFMLLFTFEIMDIGRLLWTYTTLTRATEAAARCGAINPANCSTSIPAYAASQAWGLTGITFTPSTQSCGEQVVGTYPFQFLVPQFGSTAPFGSPSLTLSATACYPIQP